MAIIRQGILGGFSGKVANVVGSSWKGIAIMKSRPLSVANPRTAGQVAQRTKFSNVVAFAKEILSVFIKPLWDRFAVQASGFNDFVRVNISQFESEMPSVPADLVTSQGKMEETEMDTCASTEGAAEVDITWTDDSGEGYKLATDLVYAVVVNETQEVVSAIASTATRADELATLTIDSRTEAGDVIHVYVSFRRADGTVVSNNSYNLCSIV